MTEITFNGIGAAEGIAVGPAFVYEPVQLIVPDRKPGPVDDEMAYFDAATQQAETELEALHQKMLGRADKETAAIFEAHSMILMDPTLRETVEVRIQGGVNVERGVSDAAEEIAVQFEAMEDEYFAARALDIRDVGRRILRILLGVEDRSLDAMQQASIVVAHDLTPSDTANLDENLTLALLTAVGGLTSHTAILARTLGLPAVVGIGDQLLAQITSGTLLALNGASGEIVLNPAKKTQKAYADRKTALDQWQAELRAVALDETYNADGRRVEVAANIGDARTARDAVELGAEGVGLLRTEFLYLNETTPPSEEKQYRTYKSIFQAMGARPIVVRTLDIGGDKPPSYLPFPDEMNPFLGWRAIRICMDQPAIFKPQLRAILRAAIDHSVMIMYPMISGVDELVRANAVLQEVKDEMDAGGTPYNPDVPVGIMVETPGAVMMADKLADYVDFFSIGTNDLTQYTLAVDRTNQQIAYLYEPLHPAVLRLIRHTIEAAHSKGKWVGMCGELAGMKPAIPILLGMGLDEFSMAAQGIPEAKWLIRQLADADAKAIADHALDLPTADHIVEYMDGILKDLGLPG